MTMRLSLSALGSAAVLFGAVGCNELPSSGATPAGSTLAASAAFASAPLGFSDVASSFSGGGDGGERLFLPGRGSRPFGNGGLMGGGIDDAFIGGVERGHGFGNHGPFGGPSGGPLACEGTFSPATGRVDCNVATHDGLTIVRSVAYADASGQVQHAFDSVTTNSVNVRSDVSGTVDFGARSGDDQNGGEDGGGGNSGPGHHHHFEGGIAGDTTTIVSATTSVHHTSDRTVTGLAQGSAQRLVDGASKGEETTTGTSSQGAFTASRTAADTTRGLVIPLTSDGHPYPTAGTVLRVMQATVTFAGKPAAMTTRREVVTYDGSTTATVTITTDGTTRRCTLPLPRGHLRCQ